MSIWPIRLEYSNHLYIIFLHISPKRLENYIFFFVIRFAHTDLDIVLLLPRLAHKAQILYSCYFYNFLYYFLYIIIVKYVFFVINQKEKVALV